MGLAVGYGGRQLLTQVHLAAGGLYAVLTMALAFVAFGLTTLLQGSGFLAVYAAAVVLGNSRLPYRTGLLRVHDAIAWLSQVTMFLVLGLLVYPSRLVAVWEMALWLALLLAFVARPLVVALCLVPFRYPVREVAYIGWVGLRGAVPIILATFPVLSQVPGALRVFDIVFFVVVVNALVPGATVKRVTRWLGLEARTPPPPQAVLEIASTLPLQGDVVSFHIARASAVAGTSIADIPFPPGTSVMLVLRGQQLIAPRGDTVLQPGDHVSVFCRPEDRGLVQLLFGGLEEE
jgi:cell volume regulation protein A